MDIDQLEKMLRMGLVSRQTAIEIMSKMGTEPLGPMQEMETAPITRLVTREPKYNERVCPKTGVIKPIVNPEEDKVLPKQHRKYLI